jgi:hypothetical protein
MKKAFQKNQRMLKSNGRDKVQIRKNILVKEQNQLLLPDDLKKN